MGQGRFYIRPHLKVKSSLLTPVVIKEKQCRPLPHFINCQDPANKGKTRQLFLTINKTRPLKARSCNCQNRRGTITYNIYNINYRLVGLPNVKLIAGSFNMGKAIGVGADISVSALMFCPISLMGNSCSTDLCLFSFLLRSCRNFCFSCLRFRHKTIAKISRASKVTEI